ncbi:toprim domain-containing protein [Haliea sp. E17]|uniref:toprim domain-containing protein n=1 Tax=Haliea sp. E17 TaxID=3401576 RepID=UPI003AACA90B
MFDHYRQFADAIFQDTGAVVEPVADGKLHRFDDPEGKRHNRACWYVFHADGFPAGAYGNWRTGFQSRWNGQTERPTTPEERERAQAVLRQAREQRQREKALAQQSAAERAQFLWENSQPATVPHPYLAVKQISALGLRQHQGQLLVPLRTVSGELVNLQRIYPDGAKRFLLGGRITGTFWLMGEAIPKTGKLYIAEGMATAATIGATLRQPVIAAMNAGNLIPVAETIRENFPKVAIVIAADNDHRTPGNPGLTKGTEAARKVQGELTWPTTCREVDCCCTDFNDTANCGRAPQ